MKKKDKIAKALGKCEHKKPHQGFNKGKATASVALTKTSTAGKAKLKK